MQLNSTHLENPACRLLTLVGPGGVGKTRLASQAAADAATSFTHGVRFVSLGPVPGQELLVSVIIDALGLPLRGSESPKAQVLAFLQDKEMLLVLDNLEHLLQGTDLLIEMLRAAPALKVLVTSRERLNFQAEWLLDVQGLPYPPLEASAIKAFTAEEAEKYSAVKLFLERARQLWPGFALSDKTRSAVARVCQLVEGMPLAIELAASWVREMDPSAIAVRIARDLDALTTTMRDLPERHRSLRAVFEHSWQLLSPVERRVFHRLAVFRGGFTREAAAYVADASPPLLAALVNKSLLRSLPDGRHDFHELVRQYAVEKLAESPPDTEFVYKRHSNYYGAFLQRWEPALKGAQQIVARQRIETEIDNVRAAWDRVVTHQSIPHIVQASEGLFRFYLHCGKFQDGGLAFSQAVATLRKAKPDDGERPAPDSLTIARLTVRWAYFSYRLGQFEEAGRLVAECLPVLREHGTDSDLVLALNCLGCVLIEQGAYTKAQVWLEEGLALAEAIGDHTGRIFLLKVLGAVAFDRQEYARAEEYYRTCLRMTQEIGDQANKAYAINHLGTVAYMLGCYSEARDYYKDSLLIFEQIADYWGICLAYTNLGEVLCDLNDYVAAARYLHMALEIATELGATSSILYLIFAWARLLAFQGQKRQALELLEFMMRHPASGISTKEQARPLLAQLTQELPAAVVSATRRRSQIAKLHEYVNQVLAVSL